ncbi:MAG TPA: TIGR02587 family membrane protein [Pyrinomonadaceae bacterium]|nr:TIGR02587 family membrane protein [Pyrinomonadaceae bacterium]
MASRARSRRAKTDEPGFLATAGRAYAGAILFSFPILMTMEMWGLGASLSGFRLALFLVLSFPLLVALSYYDGFEDTTSLKDDIVDTFVAYTVGFSTSAVVLVLFNILNHRMSADELVGKITILAVPTSLGAVLAQSLLLVDDTTESHAEARKRSATYAGQLFLMIAGGVFLSMSVAPTEEMYLISFIMSDWHLTAVMLFSLVVMHAFIHAVEYSGHANALSPNEAEWSVFLRYTVVGYAMILVVSYYILWTFGSIDGMGAYQQLKATAVLGVPAALGASASRLIL